MKTSLARSLGLALAFVPSIAFADAVGDFYRGKQVRMVLGFATGGGDDTYGRLLAKHMPRYIPGEPTLIIQNQPGAGSLNAANAIYNIAPRDGTVFGMTHRFVPLMPLLGVQGPKFDPLKFTYIGSMNREIGLCIAMKTAGFKSMDDMKTREFVAGTTGAGAELTTFYATLQNMLGIKLRIIKGYQSSFQVNLAMESGEIQGRCGVSYSSLKSSKPDWLEANKIDVLLQLGLHKDPELPNVPLLADIVTDDRDHRALQLLLGPSEIGRPFMAPPDLPADRTVALRKAFMDAVKDPEMTKDAKLQRLDLEPVDGAEMQSRVAEFYKAPENVVARTRELVAMGGAE
ncbi:MAG: Bug family tripartite tricarboxylate transporter substrate binding protein [Gemmatimonas sp.]